MKILCSISDLYWSWLNLIGPTLATFILLSKKWKQANLASSSGLIATNTKLDKAYVLCCYLYLQICILLVFQLSSDAIDFSLMFTFQNAISVFMLNDWHTVYVSVSVSILIWNIIHIITNHHPPSSYTIEIWLMFWNKWTKQNREYFITIFFFLFFFFTNLVFMIYRHIHWYTTIVFNLFLFLFLSFTFKYLCIHISFCCCSYCQQKKFA